MSTTTDGSFTIASTAWWEAGGGPGGYIGDVTLASPITPASDNSYFIFKPYLSGTSNASSFATFSNWDISMTYKLLDLVQRLLGSNFLPKKLYQQILLLFIRRYYNGS